MSEELEEVLLPLVELPQAASVVTARTEAPPKATFFQDFILFPPNENGFIFYDSYFTQTFAFCQEKSYYILMTECIAL